MSETSSEKLPERGERVVHRDDLARGEGPVWGVTDVDRTSDRPVAIEPVPGHRANVGLPWERRRLTGAEYRDTYRPI